MKRVFLLMGLGLIVGLTSCGGPSDEEVQNDVDDIMDELMEDLDEDDSSTSDSDLVQEDFICIWEYAQSDGEDMGEDDFEFFGDWSYLSMPQGSGGADWYAGYYEFDGDMIILDEGIDCKVLSVSGTLLQLEIDGEVRDYNRVEEENEY